MIKLRPNATHRERVMFSPKQFINASFVVALLFLSIFAVNGLTISAHDWDKSLDNKSQPTYLEEVQEQIIDESSFVDNDSFDSESLQNYINSLFDEDIGLFSEIPGGIKTTVATYESLSIFRFLGLDYHYFDEWQDAERKIANYLIVELKDDSGGFLLTPDVKTPSLEGTFGVVTSLWIMNELPIPRLKDQALGLLDFVINDTFNPDEGSFHKKSYESTIKAVYQALIILDLAFKVATHPDIDFDNAISKPVNKTVLSFMTNHSENIFNFIASKSVGDSYFDSQNQYLSPIEETWYALKSIEILEKFGSILGITYSKRLADYEDPVKNWLKSQIKETGKTKGGFGTSDYATVSETGLAYAILNLFNATSEINHENTIRFIYSSQFLERENRSYLASESIHFGGFAKNNLTYNNPDINKMINIHDTYYALLTLLLSNDIFSSIELSLETSHYKDTQYVNRSNLIIQGQLADIDQIFTTYNYKSHGSLELISIVDNWNLTHLEYTETNSAFTGKEEANYKVKLENDSQNTFNWTLGSHLLTNILSIRNLPVIRTPEYNLTTSLFVGYEPKIDFDPFLIKPGDNVNSTIFYQNRSTLTYSTQNITIGSLSINITSPINRTDFLYSFIPINTTINATKFTLSFPAEAVLGTYELTLLFNQSDYFDLIHVPIEVSDTVSLYNVSKVSEYYPGNFMNLNVSLKYTNGKFTPDANATLVFISNKTNSEVFNLPLDFIKDNTYSTRNSNCPTRNLYGFYNISVRLTWNLSSGFRTESIHNNTLPNIPIRGNPVLIPINFKTDNRTSSLQDENSIFYGETIYLNFTVGFEANNNINNLSEARVVTKAGLVNNSKPLTFIQTFKITQENDTLILTDEIDPNFPIGTYGSRFQILSEWNNSFIYLRNLLNISENAAYNFTIDGDFALTDITYWGGQKSNGEYSYALDVDSIITVTFRVSNSKKDNILVANLNLYGILKIEGDPDFNKSLPSITSAIDESGLSLYQLSIPLSGIKTKDYRISIYTWTSINNNYLIGTLGSGFSVVKTHTPKPIIQLHELLILIAGLGVIILGYLNFRKLRL